MTSSCSALQQKLALEAHLVLFQQAAWQVTARPPTVLPIVSVGFQAIINRHKLLITVNNCAVLEQPFSKVPLLNSSLL